MTQSIYFASTILHLYAAAAIAAGRPNEKAHLIFMDQPENVDFPLYRIAQHWQLSPFATTRLFYGRFKGLANKLKKRKALFHQLDEVITAIRPQHIFVGNDRRIEFQYSMHITETLGLNTCGHYMDEGTFTYVGRKASGGFNDRVVDNYLKKLSYGFWWKNPPTVGGSDWIQQVHVAFPQLIHPLLQTKQVVELDSSRFTAKPLQQLSSAIMEHHGLTSSTVSNLSCLITLPHESLFEHQPGYREQMLSVIKQKTAQGKLVAAKYHPRNSNPDALSLEKEGVRLLPASVSFEAILPLLPDTAEVIGDVSSTLLITKWLRPELKATSYTSEKDASAFIAIFKQLNISIVSL